MKHYRLKIITEAIMGEDGEEVSIETYDIKKATAFLAYWSEH
jgi:hypothetical protein